MRLAEKLFRFFIYSNLFIACCALLMVYQACQLWVGTLPSLYFSLFIFFATISSYSFHWYLTPVDAVDLTSRSRWLEKNRSVHLGLFLLGFPGAVVMAIYLHEHWHWLLLAALITFLYSAPKIPHPMFRLLRKVALGKTIFLAFTWTYVTAILPLQVAGIDWETGHSLFAAHRFFLIYAICILFDYRDREYDKKVGIRSLITWFSETGIRRLFFFSFALFLVFTIALYFVGQPSLIILVLVVPGLITAVIHRRAMTNFSDLLYYFILDGLMALSSLLTLAFF